ncbi:MAG: hypothetical protein IPK73_20935 [Candidatus Obscuribacter sp.]|nr:hypothetical protein [Candidatus Obscuribacter sp.]MBK9276583.1 hypothetical protein [Candidatus Obscuribacter sp.]
MQVQAKNAFWTPTGVTVSPGQTVWLDFRADGNWGTSNGAGSVTGVYTADGIRGYSSGGLNYAYNSNYNLIGAVAPAGNTVDRLDSGFHVGSSLYKYKPTKTGPLVLGFNNETWHGNGEILNAAESERAQKVYYERYHQGNMIVRIIVTN